MKTIKELEALKLGEDRSYLNEGYLEALKEVLGLIDESNLCDWCKQELKKRITG